MRGTVVSLTALILALSGAVVGHAQRSSAHAGRTPVDQGAKPQSGPQPAVRVIGEGGEQLQCQPVAFPLETLATGLGAQIRIVRVTVSRDPETGISSFAPLPDQGATQTQITEGSFRLFRVQGSVANATIARGNGAAWPVSYLASPTETILIVPKSLTPASIQVSFAAK
jgi:hypothetical protein